MRLLVGMMLFGLIALCAVSLGSLRSSMMEDRKVQTKHLVESGASILKHFHALAQAGTLSEADAKKAATEALRAVRYDGNNYLFIVTTATTTSCCRPSPRWKARTPAA
jgi:methyl-accepting chemotaxis protein